MIRSLLAFCTTVALLVACTEESSPTAPEGEGVETSGDIVPSKEESPLEKAAEGVKEDLEKAASEAAKQTEEAAEEVKETVAEKAEELGEKAEEVEEAAEEAKEDVEEAVQELSGVVESTFSLEKLKEMIPSLSTPSLEQLAERLQSALTDQKEAIARVREKIEDVTRTNLLEIQELKESLPTLTEAADLLKEKLSVVTDTLKERGVDVSRFLEPAEEPAEE